VDGRSSASAESPPLLIFQTDGEFRGFSASLYLFSLLGGCLESLVLLNLKLKTDPHLFPPPWKDVVFAVLQVLY
jgi:hypothetical protein